MTRLTHQDIEHISQSLCEYDKQLAASTGYHMIEIACHCYGVEVDLFIQRAALLNIRVVPVTAGLGIISGFTDTVVAILNFLGISTECSSATDVEGLAFAVTDGVDGIFMSDDHHFIGMDLSRRKIVDNCEATGKIYATALSLMAGGLANKKVMVAGCGRVGANAARKVLELDARLTLVDTNIKKAEILKEALSRSMAMERKASHPITIDTSIDKALANHDYILDATPDPRLVPDGALNKAKMIAIPGVPPGLSVYGFNLLENRVIHDKLELGVAAMAVELLA